MALLFACGFDGMVTADINKFFTSQGGRTVLSGGSFGGATMRAGNDSGRNFEPKSMGRYLSLSTPAGQVCSIATTTLTVGEWGSGGVVLLHDGSVFVNKSSTAVGSYNSSLPAFLEVDLEHPQGVSVAVNGLIVYTGAAPAGSISVAGSIRGAPLPAGNFYSRIDSIVSWDDAEVGDGFSTFPLGPLRVQQLQNTGAGDSDEWGDGGDNWSRTTSSNWSGGLGVETETNAATDMFQVTDMAWDSVRVKAVIHRTLAADIGTGGNKLQLLSKIGGDLTGSQDIALPSISHGVQERIIADPSLSVSGVNSMQLGYKAVIS